MSIEMNKSPSVRLTPVQEIHLAKPATDLYVGQVLKTVVVTALTNDQVLININGQNLNAKTAHHFSPGDLLEVKVTSIKDQTVLEVQQQASSSSVLQTALLQALPKQAPATQLLHTLNQLKYSQELPLLVTQQIRGLLNTITPLSQLPQQLMQAINQSGVFLESELLKWQRGMNSQGLKGDFKASCFKLLDSLPDTKNKSNQLPGLTASQLNQDPLPLAGAIPQPLQKDNFFNVLNLSSESMQHLLKEQVNQVLARITANQINHLSHDNKNGFLIMLDVPIQLKEGTDVVPIMIKQHKAAPMQASKWSLSFALNLEQLGNLQGRVSLAGDHLDVHFNAEQERTITILNNSQTEMESLLKPLGLNLRDWKVQQGLEDNHIDVKNLRLLDIKV